MFPSISNAVLSETVTSEFTATESCQVGVPTGSGYTVKKNDVVVTSSPIGLDVDDVISISTTAPSSELTASFVEYTYNSVTSKFAIVTGLADARPKIYAQYQNLIWSDYLPTKHDASVLNMFSEDETSFDMTVMQGGSTAQKLAAILDPLTNSVYFVDYTGVTRASKILPNKPIYSTSFYNSTSNDYEFYILTDVGKIYRINRSFVITESSQVFPYAKTIFTDGENLCLSYLNPTDNLVYLVRFRDLNTVATSTVPGGGTTPVRHGIAFNNSNKWLLARSSNVQHVNVSGLPNTLDLGQAGQMCWHRGKVAVPFSSTYSVKLYRCIDGSNVETVTTLDTGDYLPFQCTSNGSYIFITCYNSTDILRWDGISSTYNVYSFSKKVTSVSVIDDWLIGSHYLKDLDTTYSPNPTASGINFVEKKGSVGSLIGSGYQDYVTNGGSATIQLQDNMKAWVNGYPSNTISSGQSLVVALEATAGKVSMPVVIKNQAFDYIVEGMITTAKSLDIAPDITVLGTSSEVTFNITLPVLLDPTYVSATVGELKVNGQVYNGETTVTTDDVVDVTVRVPTGATGYYTVLSVANSDFALVAANDDVVDVETEYNRPRGDNLTETTFSVDTSGLYYFPELRNAQLTIDGVGVVETFPVNISSGTSVTIRHTTVSDFINDTRYTYLFGPTIYRVQSSTLADGIPDYIDFGTLVGAIPDFEYTSSILTITGMSPDYPTVIHGKDGLEISINGSPYSETVTIEQGDSIQVRWLVKNLWTPSLKLYTILNLVQEYEVGSWNIAPPTGAFEDPNETVSTPNVTWLEYDQQSKFKSFEVATRFAHSHKSAKTKAPVADSVPAIHLELTTAALGLFNHNSHTELTSAATGNFFKQVHIEWPDSPDARVSKLPWNDTSAPQGESDVKGLFHTRELKQSWEVADTAVFAEPPVSAVDARLVERHAHVTYLPRPTYEVPYNETTYLPLPDFASIDPSALYDPQPTYDYLWHTELYSPGVKYGKPQIARYVTLQWSKAVALFIDTAPHPIPAEIEHRHYVPLVPKFTIYSPTAQNNIDTAYENSKRSTFEQFANIPAFTKGLKPFYNNLSAVSFADELTVSDSFTIQGGQATESQAQAVGQSVANGLPITTYQQPEGSWSYIITRPTDLVCAVQETGLFVKAWLLGGG